MNNYTHGNGLVFYNKRAWLCQGDEVEKDLEGVLYYLEYIFADTTYDKLDDCNNKGNALKKDLPSKFSSFKCQKDSDNYILKIK